MATQDRTQARAVELSAAIERAPHSFDFFQAVRHIESVNPDKPRIGRSVRPVDDPVRFGQEPSMAFAPSAIARYIAGKNGRAPWIKGLFFGLLGPNGPMPSHLTEYAYGRLHNSRDTTFARFLDVFHHRMMSLFYRAWSNARPEVSFDRPEADWFGMQLGALSGIGMRTLRDRDELPDVAKLHYAGFLACQTRHPAGLQHMIEDYFKVPARIEEFVGAWMELPEDGICQLGKSDEAGTLGVNAIAGRRIWGCHQKFRIVVGPLDMAGFDRLLPGGDHLKRLVAMVRTYTTDELAWDVNLTLKRDEVPSTRLGETGRLGWTTWIGTRREETDADELILDATAYVN